MRSCTERTVKLFNHSLNSDVTWILLIGSFFAWLWSVVVYAPVLMEIAFLKRGNPDLFRTSFYVAFLLFLILCSILQKTGFLNLNLRRKLSITSSICICLVTVLLPFTPTDSWYIPGVLSGISAAMILSSSGDLMTAMESEQIPNAAIRMMVLAALLHFPAAAFVMLLPLSVNIALISVLPLFWAIIFIKKEFGKSEEFEEKSKIYNSTHRVHIKQLIVFSCSVLLMYLASSQIFLSLHQNVIMPRMPYNAENIQALYTTTKGSLYISQDVLGTVGMILYIFGILFAGLYAKKRGYRQIILRGMLLCGFSLLINAACHSFASMLASFILLQFAIAFVDICFIIFLMEQLMKKNKKRNVIIGLFMLTYSLGFAPLLLISPENIVLPETVTAAGVFLMGTIWLGEIYLAAHKKVRVESAAAQDRESTGIRIKDNINHSHLTGKEKSIQSLLKFHNLTPRETEIAFFLLKGISGTEIASCCNITKNTVKTHVRRLLEKTGNHNAKEFIVWVLNEIE